MHVLTTVDATLGRSTFVVVRFSVLPFSGSVGEADAPPFYLLPRLAPSASEHCYLFLKGVSQNLGCLVSLDSQPCLIWAFAWGIRSWRSSRGSIYLPEGVPKLSGTLRNIFSHWKFPRELMQFFFCPIFLAVSTLVSGLLFSSAIVWRVSLVSCLSQKVPCFLGAPKLSEGLIRACEQYTRKSSLLLLVTLVSK